MAEPDETESSGSSDSDEGDSSSLADLAERLESDASAEQSREETPLDSASEVPDSSQTSSLSEFAASVRGDSSVSEERSERGRSSGGVEFTDADEAAAADAGSSDTAAELDADAVALLDSVEDETNVLLVGPTGSATARRLCERLMTPASPSKRHHQLVVAVDTPSDDQRDVFREMWTDAVESQVLVDAQSYAVSQRVDYDDRVNVLNVPTARDLRRIGILTTKMLSQWRDAEVSSTVCLHSLSALLAAVDETERVFRFVHILQERVRAADARSHFYLDPSRHDEQTIRTFFSLFETILEFDADGALRRL